MRRFFGCLAAVLSLFVAGWSAAPASASFPGRNGLLAIQPLHGTGIDELRPDGKFVIQICELAWCDAATQPRWSPDGRSLAFVDASSSRVGVVAADGTCLWCLLGPPLSSLRGTSPAFTAKGQNLTVANASSGVWRIPLAGGTVRSVTSGAQAEWSSAGELALVRRGAVWLRGRGRRARFHRLTRGTQPNWSPDGEEVAVVRRGWIWIVPTRGGHAHRLVAGHGPAWSPDGRQIAYIARGHWVRIVTVRSGRSRRLRAQGRALDWQPLPRHLTRSCSVPPGWILTARSGQAVVASTSQQQRASFFGGYYGCLRGLGTWHLLLPGTANFAGYSTSVSGIRLAGRFALLNSAYSDKYQNCSLSLDLYDLATGRKTPLALRDCSDGSDNRLDSPALDSLGFAAWRLVTPLPRSDCVLEGAPCLVEQLFARDDGGTRVIDSTAPGGGTSITGPFLADNSLSLLWEHDGQARQTPLH